MTRILSTTAKIFAIAAVTVFCNSSAVQGNDTVVFDDSPTVSISTIKQMKQYYNAETNTYEFENVEFLFDVDVDASIDAATIHAREMRILTLTADSVDAREIDAFAIDAETISVDCMNAEMVWCHLLDCADASVGNLQADIILAEKISCNYLECDSLFADSVDCFSYKGNAES